MRQRFIHEAWMPSSALSQGVGSFKSHGLTVEKGKSWCNYQKGPQTWKRHKQWTSTTQTLLLILLSSGGGKHEWQSDHGSKCSENRVLSQAPKESAVRDPYMEGCGMIRYIWMEIEGYAQVSSISSASVPLQEKSNLVFISPEIGPVSRYFAPLIQSMSLSPSG